MAPTVTDIHASSVIRPHRFSVFIYLAAVKSSFFNIRFLFAPSFMSVVGRSHKQHLQEQMFNQFNFSIGPEIHCWQQQAVQPFVFATFHRHWRNKGVRPLKFIPNRSEPYYLRPHRHFYKPAKAIRQLHLPWYPACEVQAVPDMRR
jgi:hypothetical protein